MAAPIMATMRTVLAILLAGKTLTYYSSDTAYAIYFVINVCAYSYCDILDPI